jgi:hypothetical protein
MWEIFVLIATGLMVWGWYAAANAPNENAGYVDKEKQTMLQARELNVDDQLSVFAKIARDGNASALSSHTWLCLKKGRHAEALALYEETRTKLTTTSSGSLAWSMANCDNNQALNLMATGVPIEKVKKLWDRNISMNHDECTFYSTMAKVRTGSGTKADVAQLPRSVRAGILETLTSGTTTSGWYKKWCKEVLAEFGTVL